MLDIFRQAASLVLRYRRELLRLGLPVVFCAVSVTVYRHVFQPDIQELSLSLTNAPFFLVYAFWLAVAAVWSHRLFIGGVEVMKGYRFPGWSGIGVIYGVWWLLIGTLSALFVIPLIFLTPTFGAGDSHGMGWFGVESAMPIICTSLVFYWWARMSLILPSCAIGQRGRGLIWAWRTTIGNGWRMTLLIGAVPLLLEMLLGLMPTDVSLFISLLSDLLWLATAVFELALLSLSYAFLVEGRNVV